VMDLDWGNVPAGTGAVLTGVSLMIAALTYRRSVANAEAQQAESIATWIDNAPDGRALIIVRNASTLPVYMVEIYLDDEVRYQRFYLGTILPESTRELQTTVELRSALPVDKLRFVDSAGREWQKTSWGRVRRRRIPFRERPAIVHLRRHPLDFIRWVLPSVYFGLPIIEIAPELSSELEAFALHEGHKARVVRSALAKFPRGRRLSMAEKRVIQTLVFAHPELLIEALPQDAASQLGVGDRVRLSWNSSQLDEHG
jgi:hypothetical protein